MLRETGGGSTTKGTPPNSGPKICQIESTKVGAVWKQTTSPAENGCARCIQRQRFRIPVGPQTLSILSLIDKLALKSAALQVVRAGEHYSIHAWGCRPRFKKALMQLAADASTSTLLKIVLSM